MLKNWFSAFSWAYIELWMHLGGLESTQEARVALGYRLEQLLRFFRALQTSRMHPWLDMSTLSMNQFFRSFFPELPRMQVEFGCNENDS